MSKRILDDFGRRPVWAIAAFALLALGMTTVCNTAHGNETTREDFKKVIDGELPRSIQYAGRVCTRLVQEFIKKTNVPPTLDGTFVATTWAAGCSAGFVEAYMHGLIADTCSRAWEGLEFTSRAACSDYFSEDLPSPVEHFKVEPLTH